MADGQTSSQTATTTGSEPAGGSTSGNNGSSAGKTEKVNIKVASSGGGFSFDEFNRAMGNETDNVDEPDEPEVEEGSGELLDYPKEATDEPRVEDRPSDEEDEEDTDDEGDEEDAEEGSDDEELEALGKDIKKGGIKAFTKDGKPITLPPDLEIEQMVDGEPRKINLREHLNVVAGELTVEERLEQVKVFRNQVETRRQGIEEYHNKFQEGLQTMGKFAMDGRPDLAICFLAEMNGTSPVQMREKFLEIIVAEAAKYEGKSELEIKNHFLELDRQWREGRDKKKREKEDKKAKADSFVSYVTQELQKENISPDEFTAASQELNGRGELRGLSQDRALDRVIEHALLTKHTTMAQAAIALVDPKLAKSQKLIDKLLDATHPNKYTVEEMADVVSDYLGKARTRIASSLSKKVRPHQVRAKSERQSEAGKEKKKVYRSQGDLQRAFGL